MRSFATLFTELDSTTATTAMVDVVLYFASAPPADAAWAVYFLSGGKPRQVVKTAQLRALACQEAGLEDWLFEAAYQAVGDLAETIAHILPQPGEVSSLGLSDWITQRLLPLRGQPEAAVAARVTGYWRELVRARPVLAGQARAGGSVWGSANCWCSAPWPPTAGWTPDLHRATHDGLHRPASASPRRRRFRGPR